MRQGHPELNFRMGKGRIRELRKAFARDSLEALCDFLGLPPAEKGQFLEETDAIREGKPWRCVECNGPMPVPTSDPFRCPTCRGAVVAPRDAKENT